jgi:hypothetical protein
VWLSVLSLALATAVSLEPEGPSLDKGVTPDDVVPSVASVIGCVPALVPVEPVPPVPEVLTVVDTVGPGALDEVVELEVVVEMGGVGELVVTEETPVVSVPVPDPFSAEQ